MCNQNALALAVSSIVVAGSIGGNSALAIAISTVPEEGHRALIRWKNSDGVVTIGALKSQLCSMMAPLEVLSGSPPWTAVFLQRACELARQLATLTGALPLLTVDESIEVHLKNGREAAERIVSDNRATIDRMAEALIISGELTEGDIASLLSAA